MFDTKATSPVHINILYDLYMEKNIYFLSSDSVNTSIIKSGEV